MAGHPTEAVRMHLSRSARASTSATEIEALRDAMHWALPDSEQRREVCGRLGAALLARARAEGIATERDRERVAEAARLLADARKWLEAGEAWLLVDNRAKAIDAFSAGGHVEQLERALDADATANARRRTVRQSFADYELHVRTGARNAARRDLRAVVEAAENKAEYQRLLDDLESRLITGGRVQLHLRRGANIVVCAASPVSLGRDALCDLMLRSGGVSRRHVEIAVDAAAQVDARFTLRDAGSRNGTLIGGLPISGAVPLRDEGTFDLGDAYTIRYAVTDAPALLILVVDKGFETGTHVFIGVDGQLIDLSAAGIRATLRFADGCPILERVGDAVLQLDGQLLAHGTCQLIQGDQLRLDGLEVEVV